MKKALIAFISIWILAVLINQYTGWSVQDLLPPTPVKVRTLTPQEEASFPPPVKIEDKFYRFSSRHPDVWSKPLYADKKTAILINWNPKPRPRQCRPRLRRQSVIKRCGCAATY